MLSTIRRELKDNLGDQLRGFRHVIRTLGSETPESGLVKQHLPPMPPELDRLFGKTFHALDDMFITLDVILSPLRPSQSDNPHFSGVDFYFNRAKASGSVQAVLTDELYTVLKQVAHHVRPNQLILKARMAGVSKALLSLPRPGDPVATNIEQCCADLFLSLVQHDPMVAAASTKHESWKQYAAVSLLFGLALSKRLGEERLQPYLHDAILMCGLRAEVFTDAAHVGKTTEALLGVYASLLRHLP